MGIYVGDNEIKCIYLGDTPLKEVYLGDTKIRPAKPVYPTYCCFLYTGEDQHYIAPYTGYYCVVAFGGSSGYTSLGYGGCSSGCIYMNKDCEYSIMVGFNQFDVYNCGVALSTYGFGGCGGRNCANRGGGLSGVFTGCCPIGANDATRALIIAGGSGSGGSSSSTNCLGNMHGGGTNGSNGGGGSGGTQTSHGTSGNASSYQFCGGNGTGRGGPGGGGRRGGMGSSSCQRGGGGGSGYIGGVVNGATINGSINMNGCCRYNQSSCVIICLVQ